MDIYNLKESDFIAAKLFATKNHKFHKNYSLIRNRSDKEKIENIRIGKLGEIIFKNLKQDEIIDKDPTKDNKPSIYDFRLKSGKTIDIKTIDASWKKRVYINFDIHNPADIFVVVLLDENNKKGSIIGQLTKEEVGKNLRYDSMNDTYYVELRLFK